jgi:16S rRNA (uracil1498-N3)-methyltransferase
MNLVLLDPQELDGESNVELTGRRAQHLLKVLRVEIGDRVRVGVLDGAQGHAQVLARSSEAVRLHCVLDQPAPMGASDTLLIGFARPKVLLRCFEHAAALGFGRIIVFRSRRVEKSHMLSHAVEREHYTDHLKRGLEQARRTRLPEVFFVQRFRVLVEDELARLLAPENRFVADPEAAIEAPLASVAPAPLSLVIGPEGGLSDHELGAFAEHGFQAVYAGREPLRVETALSYLTGQLRAARTLRAHS